MPTSQSNLSTLASLVETAEARITNTGSVKPPPPEDAGSGLIDFHAIQREARISAPTPPPAVVPTSFSSAAALPPSIDDLDAALHKNARQRRVVLGAIGGAVGIVAMAFGVMAFRHHAAPPPVAAAAVVAPPPVVAPQAPVPPPPPVVTPPPPAPSAAMASAAPEAPAAAKPKKHKAKHPKSHSPKLTKVSSSGT